MLQHARSLLLVLSLAVVHFSCCFCFHFFLLLRTRREVHNTSSCTAQYLSYRSHQHSHTKVWYNRVETHEKKTTILCFKIENKREYVPHTHRSFQFRWENCVCIHHLDDIYIHIIFFFFSFSLFCVFLLHFVREHRATIFFYYLTRRTGGK